MNRRTFVSSLAAAGAVASLPSRLMGAVAPVRLKVGLIGCGWFGGVALEAFLKVAKIEVVSLCDPNAKNLGKSAEWIAATQSAPPKTFADYREMLSSNSHDIVIVSTPDHWHALPAIAAMKAGADVFLEKPISVDVIEGEAMVAAARKYGRVAQVNLQRRSTPLFAEAKERYLDSGKLGTIGLVECYYYGGGERKVIPSEPVPGHLDYDFWAGPAEKVPYISQIESRQWRMFQEYGNGTIGDMGVHIFDLVRSLLGIGWPQSISSTGGQYVYKDATSNISDTQMAVFSYPGLDVSWEHRSWGKSPIPPRHWTDQWGASIIGSKGTLHLTTLGYRFEAASGEPAEGKHMLSTSGDLENFDFGRFDGAYDEIQVRHVKDFLKAREGRTRPVSDIEEGHISSASCILANVALELGRPVAYDPKSRTVPGDAEATALLARSYRGPWVHPDPATV